MRLQRFYSALFACGCLLAAREVQAEPLRLHGAAEAAHAISGYQKDEFGWGVAGQGAFGSIKAGELEISNVDLSREFSDLVVMQRGYQASSQVISTANDMLQELFQLKSGR